MDNRIEEEIDVDELTPEQQKEMMRLGEQREAIEKDMSDEDRHFYRLEEVCKLAELRGKVSVYTVQRYMGLGYGQAALLIDQLEEAGILVPSLEGFRVYKLSPDI